MKSKFINPFTDFGFKRIFLEEASKPLLIDFLNSLLPKNEAIHELKFKDKEKNGNSENDRKAVYDIFCETLEGEKFVVELQKAKQNYFKDRTIFYSTFPIQEQAQKGEWNYELKAVYCIGILDFTFNDYKNDPQQGEVIHTVQLKDQNNQLFYEKLKYIYLEMPNFTKTEVELETRLDQWLYFIKNLEDFQNIPAIFNDSIFIEAFAKAEIAKYSQEERADYEDSLKIFRDNKAVIDTAYDDGKIEGKLEGKLETARQLILLGIDIEIIIKSTGLTKEAINAL